MKALGCLGLLILLTWLGLETWAYYATATHLNGAYGQAIGSGGWWLPALWIVAMIFVGLRVVKHQVAQVVPAFLTGNAGQHVIGALGGVLLVIPGLLSDVAGLILLVPPVQMLLGKLGNAIVASVMKRMMGGMFGGKGGASPFGGRSPFGGTSPFGGFGAPSRSDDRVTFAGKRSGKTYDTVAEKD
jgi:UPF0716 protein FxsA